MWILYCFKLVYSKNYFNHVKIFQRKRLFKIMANQTVLQAWTEICHQIFGGWEVQTMWNLQNNVWYVCRERSLFQSKKKKKKKKKIFTIWLNVDLPLRTRVNKTEYGVETHQLSGKEKILNAAVRNEGQTDRLLGNERTNHYRFPWKRCNCKQYFLLQTL